MASRIALLALLFCLAAPLSAQSIPSPLEDEAPETLLDLELGDADVSFVGLGSWTTGIAPALGWIVDRDQSGALRIEPGYRFPGLEPIPFFNRVDLTLSLWLLGRYFFETTVSDELGDSTFLFGYNGLPGESVQSVIVGSTAIGMGSYPYLGFGDESGSVGQDAPGASALFETPASTHELMVRFAPAAEQEIRYANGGVVDETAIAAIDYRRGTDYVLPDDAIETLELYEQSPDGPITGSDGRRYRRVDLQQETVFSLSDGTVSFLERPDRRVFVYYESQGLPIGDPALGAGSYYALTAEGTPDPADARDFSFTALDPDYLETVGGGIPDGLSASEFVVTIGGRDAFLLHDPGRYSPFQLASRYDLERAEADSLVLTTPTGAEIDSALALAHVDARSIVVLRDPSASPRGFTNRYPLASDLVPDPVPEIYGPRASSPADAPRIVARSVRPSDSISLPAGFIPGSVRVTRNGRTERAFTVTDSGELVFDDPVSDRDVIQVSYRTSNAANSADLLVASGNRFAFAPGTEATFAIGARWKPVGERYSNRAGEYPGRVTLSAAIETDSSRWYAGEDEARDPAANPDAAARGGVPDAWSPGDASLTVRAQGAAGLSVSDTSGALRVAGMNESQREIPVPALGVFPSPPPADGTGGLTAAQLALARRGRLTYRDHFVSDFTGSRSLLRYDAPEDLVTPYPYEAGGRSGPFPALSVDEAAPGTVAVFDYEIPDDRFWVAGLVRVDGGSGSDLSNARTILVPYRVVDAEGAVRLLVQAGAIGEDLDGDGLLDAGGDGVPFDDAAAGFTLRAGTITPAGRTSTEDANGNGILDPELPELIATSNEVPVSEGGWRLLRIELDEERAWKLRETRAIRVLIARDGAGARSGRIVVGRAQALGSAFAVDYPPSALPGARVSAYEVRHASAGPYSGERLESAFPEVGDRFADPQAVSSALAVQWTGLAANDPVVLTRTVAVPLADYSTLRVFHRLAAGAPGPATIRLAAAGEEGELAASEASVSSESWQELIVSLPATQDAVVRSVVVTLSGLSSGEVLIDELSFGEPRSTVGVVGEIEVTLRPGVDLRVGALSLVRDVELTGRLGAQSASFPDDLAATRTGLEVNSEARATVVGARTLLGVDYAQNTIGSGIQTRHEIEVPVPPLSLRLTDAFRDGTGLFGPGSTHATTVTVAPVPALALTADWLSDQRERSDVRWTASARATVDFDSTRDPETPADTPRGAEGSPASAGRPQPVTRVEASADLRLREVDGSSSSGGSYPVAWVSSFARVLPATGPRQRSGSLELAGGMAGFPIAVRLEADAGFAADAVQLRRTTTADLLVEIGAPLGDALELSTTLSREARIVTSGAPLSSPADDTGQTAQILRSHPLPIAFSPYYELISADFGERFALLTETLDEASYRPSAAVELTRTIESSPWSLLVPTALGVSAARPAVRADDAVRSWYELGARALFIAPNLFGRLGSTPIFNFYETDEYQADLRVDARRDVGWVFELSADQEASVLWSDSELTLASVVSATIGVSQTSRVTATLTWTRRGQNVDLARMPLPALLADEQASVSHESALEFDYRAEDAQTALGRLTHSSSLGFGARGSIRLHGGLGIGSRTDAGVQSLVLGVRAGVEGRLHL